MSNFNGALGNHGAQSQGGGTGRGQALSTGQHSSSQANLNSVQNQGTTIIEERIKLQNGEVNYR